MIDFDACGHIVSVFDVWVVFVNACRCIVIDLNTCGLVFLMCVGML